MPAFLELAAYYKDKGDVYVGALSCMDHVKCRRVGIKGFPTLMTLNFDKKRPGLENKRIVGTHTVQEVKDYVDGVFLEAKVNETGTQPPNAASKAPAVTTVVPASAVKPGEQARKEIWEESTKPMNQTTRIQDAASAFIFGLKQGIFMGREVLEDVELDALKGWLRLVSQTFPGSINRFIIQRLYNRIEHIALLDFDTWESHLRDWQRTSVFTFYAEEAKKNFTGQVVPEWQRMSNLFVGQGVTYRACALYTCGQWNMFHMLTMNPPEKGVRSSDLMVSVIASIRRFMKHFFGCVHCRDHFLEYNDLDRVKMIADAKDKPLALRRWLWEMHNAVNTRLVHPQWPKPEYCPTCGAEGRWELVEVDKWLARTYAFKEVIVPPATEAPVTEAPTPSPSPSTVLLRKEDENKAAADGEDAEADYNPKDAELGIDNSANQQDPITTAPPVLESNLKANEGAVLESVNAPPVTLFAWYILPVAAVGGYLLFVRARSRNKASFRRLGKE